MLVVGGCGLVTLAAEQKELELPPVAFLGTGNDGQNGKKRGGEDEDRDKKVAVALTLAGEGKKLREL